MPLHSDTASGIALVTTHSIVTLVTALKNPCVRRVTNQMSYLDRPPSVVANTLIACPNSDHFATDVAFHRHVNLGAIGDTNSVPSGSAANTNPTSPGATPAAANSCAKNGNGTLMLIVVTTSVPANAHSVRPCSSKISLALARASDRLRASVAPDSSSSVGNSGVVPSSSSATRASASSPRRPSTRINPSRRPIDASPRPSSSSSSSSSASSVIESRSTIRRPSSSTHAASLDRARDALARTRARSIR